MRERQLIPMEVAGAAVSGAARMLLEEPDIEEFFGWLRPDAGGNPPGRWSAAEGTRLFAVAQRGSGIIGLAALTNIRREERYARLSCAIAPEFRREGVGHWTMTELIRHGARLDGLRHLETCVRAGSGASLHLMQSLGFHALEVPGFPLMDARPGGYVYLRLDLPAEPREQSSRAPLRVLCA